MRSLKPKPKIHRPKQNNPVNNDNDPRPPSALVDWNSLSKEDQATAAKLGYDQSSWEVDIEGLGMKQFLSNDIDVLLH